MPTDQKAGGSSPSERAQVNGPYPFRGGAFWCRWDPCWEPRRPVQGEQCLAHGYRRRDPLRIAGCGHAQEQAAGGHGFVVGWFRRKSQAMVKWCLTKDKPGGGWGLQRLRGSIISRRV